MRDGKGISKEGDILDLAVGLNLVNKSGAWFAYNGDKIGQGRENAKSYLAEHPEIMGELDKKIREHYQFAGAAGDDASDAKKEGEKAESAEGVKEPAKTARKRAVKEE